MLREAISSLACYPQHATSRIILDVPSNHHGHCQVSILTNHQQPERALKLLKDIVAGNVPDDQPEPPMAA